MNFIHQNSSMWPHNSTASTGCFTLNALWFDLLAHRLCVKRRRGGLMFCWCFFIFSCIYEHFIDSIKPIISTSTWPIFTKFAGLVELWQPILWAKSTSFPHLVVRMTFARAAPPAYDKKGNCYAGRKQTNYLTGWTQANQLTDQLTISNRRRGGLAGGLPKALLCI